jgi:hypothetical protein
VLLDNISSMMGSHVDLAGALRLALLLTVFGLFHNKTGKRKILSLVSHLVYPLFRDHTFLTTHPF